jgi:N-acetylglucosaminyldiphosphoundecaprenol N-acetyl-beta-D-mannosaminyltransferase
MAAVFGIKFSPLSQGELVRHLVCRRIPLGTGPRTVVTANLDHIAHLPENPEFRTAYDNAWVVTADGMPVYVYAKLRGAPSPARVPGSDLVAALLPALSAGKDRCFFVPSDRLTARRLQADLVRRGFSRTAVAFDVPPHGFERDPNYSSRLAARIRAHGTTHLFFGVGAPKSEIWVDRHRGQLGDCYVLCVGAGLDFLARTKRRAPVWMRRTGMEWLWRLGQEPQRLAQRYLVESWRFLGAVKDDIATGRS